MKDLNDIKKNKKITVLSSDGECLIGFVRLRASGKPRDYSLAVGMEEGGYEHVSISCMNKSYTPCWDEMCELKDICFEDEEEVVQVHPKKSQYVNIMSNCLHLWRRKGEDYFTK